MDQDERLWRLYESERAHIQHHENQRAMASNIMTAIAAGLIVASGSAVLNDHAQIAAAVLLMMIGMFGYLFCGKLTALIKLHGTRSHEYLKRMDELSQERHVAEVKKIADRESKRKHWLFGRLHLYSLWSMFHLSIFTVGAAFLVYRVDGLGDFALLKLQQLLDLLPLAQK